ncbi:ExbD/TolR family protein [Alcaligenes faecalis]|jgi:biopolymer transport protein ExbD|uniref:Biopolymer transporter ExbD n=1 Tax=Alcaligenes faecalis TaxID=511 RepID=A0ABY7N847_ALCFA|nr:MULTISPECIES: biopolymer transporter ExbD [Alcaligenes]ALO39745.1 biopolymer transporter ExbD [Alcaligenes faecalis]ARP53295.1 biopolymer transporter [Alcaligenes faecalis]ATH99302.1 biopolymer transporter ExbD [Alcaligenes faecalis]AYZ92089.1 biopolymer transporter ExbD [Alcaligenes faecalis]KAA1286742.1 biopolymer transporter ExbD [Alcaligenes faecalis]
MRFRRAQDQDTLELNLVPLIDVLLVVLIFLAASSTFVRYRQLDVSLPQAQAQAAQTTELLLAISQDGRYALNGMWLDASSGSPLSQALSTEKTDENSSLLILADAQAPHFAVVQAMEAARQVGIHRIHFATQAP